MAFISVGFGSVKRERSAIVACSDSPKKTATPLVAAAAAGAAILALSVAPADASLLHFSGKKPEFIGLRAERYLAGCPATPNWYVVVCLE